MSDGLNKVILLGNLGSDPEVRYTSTGTAVMNFRMATNESFLDRNRELTERTEWHSVVMFGPRVEGLSRVLGKGTCLLVEGTLRTSTYEKDGVKRYRTEVHARDICFASGAPRSPDMAGSVREPEENYGSIELPSTAEEPPPLAADERSAASSRSKSYKPKRAGAGASGSRSGTQGVDSYPF